MAMYADELSPPNLIPQRLDLLGRPIQPSNSDKVLRFHLSISTFVQLIEPLKLLNLVGLYEEFESDKFSKRFNTHNQLVTMIFAHVLVYHLYVNSRQVLNSSVAD
jgi:hypothetical protein